MGWLQRPQRGMARVAGLVLVRVAQWALSRGEYERAERVFALVLRLTERFLGATDVLAGTVLSDLAMVYRCQGRYQEAEQACRRAHAVFLAAHGEVARELAALRRGQGDPAGAEEVFRRAITVFERIDGPEHERVATSLTSLGALCYARGDAAEAERVYRRALEIKRKRFGARHPEVATTADNLAVVYRSEGRHAEADALYQ